MRGIQKWQNIKDSSSSFANVDIDVDHHAEGKGFIHGPKRHKGN